jgi:hypothetical protein
VANETTKPVKVFRLKGVKAAVFQNRTKAEGREAVFHKVSLQKVWKDEQSGEWKTTTSLGREDLPVARLLLDRAWQYILEAESTKVSEEAGE